jgi:putative hydrolase of the HAD superfamily
MIESVNSDISIRTAIFDGDDTLWMTEVLYDQAREAARHIVSGYGVDPDQWEAQQRIIDVENVAVYGFSAARFPASCLQAFQEISGMSGREINEEMRSNVVYAAQSVFREKPALMPHVIDVLETLRRRSTRLALLTKGDRGIQLNRIEQSGLARFFEIIEIVDEKTTATFQDLLQSLNSHPSNAWTIGNSLRSDILPALVLGIRGVWIDAPVWEYERGYGHIPEPSILKVSDIRDVLEILD